MIWLKNWLRDPLHVVLVVFGVLTIIWPRLFLTVFLSYSVYLLVRGWLSDNLERFSQKSPKLFIGFASIFCAGLAGLFFILLPYILWQAWHTGLIKGFRRWGPDPVYSYIDNPIGYWLTFGLLFAGSFSIIAGLLGLVWLFWGIRNIPIRRRRTLLDPTIPLEPSPEEAEKFRRHHTGS